MPKYFKTFKIFARGLPRWINIVVCGIPNIKNHWHRHYIVLSKVYVFVHVCICKMYIFMYIVKYMLVHMNEQTDMIWCCEKKNTHKKNKKNNKINFLCIQINDNKLHFSNSNVILMAVLIKKINILIHDSRDAWKSHNHHNNL